ncbi:metallo-beta-lactamase family protein [Corallococcus coralloides DSM 2259]|uniref:Metallo-beta-lactamase family protein n=1 Tax=Corallococcus coralloides (strain ATCC 25202 / DSM 2259 / NBRC 100086 / M2) TaxID=1144275 RepID=H8MNR6_CORCM|nr:ComEC/Rec2 family competence protein [Corallococcus coralloides]AFE08399.1 metallo-beta-lactamase family protein [Corallococcus coralloides DSM 2259]
MKVFARLLALLVLFLAAVPVHAAAPAPAALPSPAPGRLSVYFLDVGQGDAALIVSPTGKTVLIDGGPPEAGTRLAARLRELVKGPLDLVILTHPHLDHLGGLRAAVKAVGARRFMDPGFDHSSEAYRDLLDFVGREVGQVMSPEPNPNAPQTLLTVGLGEGVALTVLWPRVPQEAFLANTRSDANANSIVTKLTYGKTAFLFTGDSEPPTEELLVRKPVDLTATVLKVAHHGGKHSSTAAFLERVKPQAAVISCGVGNDYGHPSPEVLGRLGDVSARTFRTDQDGEVMAVSDGTTVTLRSTKGTASATSLSGTQQAGGPVALGPIEPTPHGRAGRSTEKEPAPTAPTSASEDTGVRYVSLKGSKVFHRENCKTLKRSKNERTVYTSRADALRERRPAEDCHP